MMTTPDTWDRYLAGLVRIDELGIELDLSRCSLSAAYMEEMREPATRAVKALQAIVGGARANQSEDRAVGHHWLREPTRAPDPETRTAIEETHERVKAFADKVLSGEISPEQGDGFFVTLVIGIGGSSLAPQLLCEALGPDDGLMLMRFLDNTDPRGIDRILAELDESLESTLVVVVSKSGTTRETRNGLAEVESALEKKGLRLPERAVAITCEGSKLDERAECENWLARFPMWDWLGGRFSATSAVGALPLALVGGDADALRRGASLMDAACLQPSIEENPAARLALAWHSEFVAGSRANLVVLPYSDLLGALPRFLQQLLMESLGKGAARDGSRVEQGITVLGNKGSTDQHALVQQLREGRDDAFVNFVTVLRDRQRASIDVAPGVTSGDCLHAFYLGTRDALTEVSRPSMTTQLDELTPEALGGLIALYENAVSLFAELIDVNAYDQPGVEAGKKCATDALALLVALLDELRRSGESLTALQLAERIGRQEQAETCFHLLRHAAANVDHAVEMTPGDSLQATTFRAASTPSDEEANA